MRKGIENKISEFSDIEVIMHQYNHGPDWLVDIAVKTNIWIRPECIKRQFINIRKARPHIIFIQSDGGRDETEWTAINEARTFCSSIIDWRCKVYYIYARYNHGMYRMGDFTRKQVFKVVDQYITLEDDDIPAVSFFSYAYELLERYKDDPRIQWICGNNPLGKYEGPCADYFFSRTPSIHGLALWKRSFDGMPDDYRELDPYYVKCVDDLCKEDHVGRRNFIRKTISTNQDDNHVPSDEFWADVSRYLENGLFITPTQNLITNVGYGDGAAHSAKLAEMPRNARKYFFDVPIYEYELPLRHPQYIIRDKKYEKKICYILGDNHPIVRTARKAEALWLAIIHGDFKRICDKIKQKINVVNER